jgi:hypothetical protein
MKPRATPSIRLMVVRWIGAAALLLHYLCLVVVARGEEEELGGCVDGSRQQGDVKLCLWKVPINNEVHHRYPYPKGPLLERLLRWFFFL